MSAIPKKRTNTAMFVNDTFFICSLYPPCGGVLGFLIYAVLRRFLVRTPLDEPFVGLCVLFGSLSQYPLCKLRPLTEWFEIKECRDLFVRKSADVLETLVCGIGRLCVFPECLPERPAPQYSYGLFDIRLGHSRSFCRFCIHFHFLQLVLKPYHLLMNEFGNIVDLRYRLQSITSGKIFIKSE